MNISYKFKKIGLFLAKYGFITILKKMADTTMAAIVTHGIPGEQTSLDGGYGGWSSPEQQVKMVAHQSPPKTGGIGLVQNKAEPIYKCIPIEIIIEYLWPADTSDDDMMKRSGFINAG